MPNGFIDTSKRPPVYFFHVPKTGGMSLRAFLADQYSDAERCPAENWETFATLTEETLKNFRLFYGHFTANLGEYLPPATRAITFIRNPIDRTISTIRHMIRDPSFHPMHHLVKGCSLREAIYNDVVMVSLQDSQMKLLSFDVPILEVLAYVRRQRLANQFVDIGELNWTSSPAKALHALESYAFVGVMEHFEHSVLKMCETFGFIPPDFMPDLNRATGIIDPAGELTEEDIEHIRGFLINDIQLYDVIRERLHLASDERSQIFSDLSSKGIIAEISDPFELDLGRPFSGSGWYGPEKQGDTNARWSGPTSRANLYLPLKRDLKRSLRLILSKPDSVPDIDIYIDGQKAETWMSRSGKVLTIYVDLPAINGQDRTLMTNILVDSKRVSQPHERNDSDLRALGVLLLAVNVT
jgi:hypothetical protein